MDHPATIAPNYRDAPQLRASSRWAARNTAAVLRDHPVRLVRKRRRGRAALAVGATAGAGVALAWGDPFGRPDLAPAIVAISVAATLVIAGLATAVWREPVVLLDQAGLWVIGKRRTAGVPWVAIARVQVQPTGRIQLAIKHGHGTFAVFAFVGEQMNPAACAGDPGAGLTQLIQTAGDCDSGARTCLTVPRLARAHRDISARWLTDALRHWGSPEHPQSATP